MAMKLILFDMDGTLLDTGKNVRPSSLDALHHACERGLICAFGTGRSISELEIYRDILPDLRYGVCESGALIYDFQEQKILRQTCLESALAREVIELSRQEDLMVQFFSDGRAYMAGTDIDHMDHFLVSQYQPLYQKVAIRTADNRAEALRHINQIEKINLFHASIEGRTRSRARMAALPAELVDSETANLEISPKGISKGSGLAQLCSILHILPEQTAAVGDADNDLEMLRHAGLPIAMGNANEAAKAASKYIVSDNDHEGIAQAVQLALTD